MDRMQEQTTRANPALAHRRGDDDAPSYGAVNVCENCGESCERLTRVPEFDYLGCDECMVEALAVIARERWRFPRATALTGAEMSAYVVAHPACLFCGSTRVEQLGPFVGCVNCKQIWNPASGRMVA